MTTAKHVWHALAVVALMTSLGGCETSHTETTSPTWTGGQKHEETTVTHNPITGSDSVEHQKEVTNP